MVSIALPFLRGLNDADGSENAWAINMAKLFIQLGHEVRVGLDCFEGSFYPDLVYIPERLDLGQDRSRWDFCKDKGRRLLIGIFNPLSQGMLDNFPSNATALTPYRSCGTRCMVVPYAYYQEPPIPGFERQTIGWTVRNPFHFQGQLCPTMNIHLHHLKSCQALVAEGYKLIIFSNYTYPNSWSDFPPLVQEAYSILEQLRNNPLVVNTNHLNYTQYLELVSKTSIVIPLTGLGSLTEALKLGSLPLSWFSPVNIYNEFSGGRDYLNLTYEEIHQKLSRLLNDKDFYHSEFNRRLNTAAVYSLPEALRLAQAAIDVAMSN